MPALVCCFRPLAMAMLLLIPAALCHPGKSNDRITTLPGQPEVSFGQYSGYIAVDGKGGRALFYYFVEAEIDPATRPLVLWLNGAMDNMVFMQRWLEKFPQYKGRELYISGESYAGHYIPQPAEVMVEFNKKDKIFNLKGLALGNPVLEFTTDFNSRAEYFWSHGLISDSTYRIFTSVCNYSRYVSEYYDGSLSPLCARVMNQVTRETSRFVDKYDVTLDVCLSSVLSQSMILSPHRQVGQRIDVCVEDETVNYLNRRDVQKALHAKLIGVKNWAVCSSVLEYELLNLQIPTINIVGSLVKSGIRVLVYRLVGGLRYTVPCFPSPPLEELHTRCHSRSQDALSCSSGHSCKADLYRKPSHDNKRCLCSN
ncbi:hypothetical protein ACQ4PT_059881 [Festuca glaucescens]